MAYSTHFLLNGNSVCFCKSRAVSRLGSLLGEDYRERPWSWYQCSMVAPAICHLSPATQLLHLNRGTSQQSPDKPQTKETKGSLLPGVVVDDCNLTVVEAKAGKSHEFEASLTYSV